ncbi:filamentous hemagglutinin family protein [Pseudomonas citronellolis]|uniref:YDG domain-containing protein n=1 Tax=Pseudomonas citronellolis TaxID=53408 RepID=UPI00209F90BF|nr:YDG domain-containing protein [Pseudomonas citronellolis]MCP1645698.1 filamentous hemagglutinin family protein [Pseudomonas citronellolis]MCP1668424.1 filamentous hemagglutinin family protein [Pseudomonas citronellolis]MCP1699970.1 filamentous hemagglutinin family protein [Pseudomonas citronellolis]MCP1706401.1 filamentous hemagglutinin family protein [Pseudomonas citronellolis]MCP1800191.1 filamentous hemagglutinin family protein [Pseudomonas citronellolis]
MSASLNHVYRLVWSDTAQAYVAVAENSTARGKRGGVVGILAALGLLGGGMAQAADLPTGGSIVAGAGSISQSGAQMTIQQNSNRLVTNWNSFDVGADARVQFQQPGRDSVALNRVVGGGNASQILGKLDANGQVWLLNPNGVVIGQGAQVNVGGLVASSLNISDADFMAGKTRLGGGSGAGAVVNQGSIKTADGGVVALIGPQVRNSGSIETPSGSSVLAAGEQVSLDFTGDGLVSVNVDRGVLDALVRNDGRISADGGSVVLSARSADAAISSVVNNSGVIEAHGLVARNGRILLDGDGDSGLTQVAGTLDASSSQGAGGSLVVTGNRVELAQGARLDASGSSAGGNIKVGGGWQGQDASVRNAQQVSVASGAELRADATVQGDGGQVVTWSDGDNSFAGSISVRGGAQGGDGGKAEVSGKQTLSYAGVADARAAKGRTGDLLLDPTNITVSGGSGTSGNWSSGSGNVTVYEQTLEAQGANVLMTATGAITFGDLTQNGGDGTISMQDNVSLRVEAGNSSNSNCSITFANPNNTIEVFGTGSLYFQSGGTGTGSISNVANLIAHGAGDNPAVGALPVHNVNSAGSGTPGAGSITLLGADGLTIAGALTTNGGYVRLSSDSDTGGKGALTINTPISTNGGNLYLSFGTTNYAESIATLNSDITLGTGRLYFGDAMGSLGMGGSTGEKRLAGKLSLSGDVNFSTPLTMLGGASIYTDGDINFTSNVNLQTGDKALTLRAENIDFSQATLQNINTASIVLEPWDIGTDIALDGTDGIASATTFTQLTGIRNLTIGRADGTGTTTVNSSGFSFDANNNLTLLNGNLVVNGALENTSSTGHAIVSAGVGDVQINGGGSISAHGSGDAVVAAAARNFINNAGANALLTSNSNGRWLTYSSDPRDDLRGGLDVDFKQYNANYGDPSLVVAQSSGNGHLYSVAPTVDVKLVGTVEKTYDGNDSAAAGTTNLSMANFDVNTDPAAPGATNGAIDGDDIQLIVSGWGSARYDDKNAGSGKTVTVDGVALGTASNQTLNGGKSVAVYGYQLSSGSVSGDVGVVDKKVLTATADVADKVYDGNTNAQLSNLNLVGVVAGDEGQVASTGSTGSFADKNAGSDKSVTGSGIGLSGAEAGNYSFDTAAQIGTADIARKVLTATADVADKVYDGNTNAQLSNVNLVGVVAGDEGQVVSTGVTGTFSDKNAGSDKSVNGSGVGLSGAEAGNYSFDTAAQIGTADITRKVLTATADVADKVYDGNTNAQLSNVNLVGVVAGDEGEVAGSGSGSFVDKNAGSDKAVSGSGVILSGSEAGNYSFDGTAQIGTADIARKALTATADVADKVYDGNTSAQLSNVSLVGVVAGDEGEVVSTGAIGSFVDKNAGNDKSVSGSGIGLTGAEANNYSFDTSAAIGTADITRKVLTATADVADKVYDGNANAQLNNVSLVGVVAGDEGQVASTGAIGSFADKNAGSDKSVSGSGIGLTGAEANNYSFDTAAQVGTADITRKVLTATADVADKVYDGSTDAQLSNVNLVGVIAGDEGEVVSTGVTGSFADKNAGADKSVTGSGIGLSGTEAGNYSFDTAAQIGTADITRKMLTATANVADKVYDGNTDAQLSDIALVGVVAGDEGKVAGNGSGSFADRNAGNDKAVSGSGIALSGSEAGNYSFDTTAQIGAADISRKVLTGTADVADKVYDGTTNAQLGNIGLVGVVAGDEGKVAGSGAGSFADKNAGSDKSVSGSGVALSGAEAGNYSFDTTAQIGNADITRKVLTGTADVADKVYDGNTNAQLSKVGLVGVVAGDEGKVVGIGSTGSFADKNAGNDKSVSGSGITLAGAEAGNYRFDTGATVGTADIARKTLGGTLLVGDKTYDGSTRAPVQGVELSGVVAGDDVRATANGLYATPSAGQGKAVSAIDLLLAGGDAGNYRIDPAQLQGTGTIEAPLYNPVGLINEPKGANATAVAVEQQSQRVQVTAPTDSLPQASTQLFSDASRQAAAPADIPVGSELLLQDAVLSGGGRQSLMLDDAPAELAQVNTLALFRVDVGSEPSGKGLFRATDLGNSITLEPVSAARQQAPDLGQETGQWASGAVARANGELLPLKVALVKDGTLRVAVRGLDDDDSDEDLASFGLALAKQRLGVTVPGVRAVVIERVAGSAWRGSASGIQLVSR